MHALVHLQPGRPAFVEQRDVVFCTSVVPGMLTHAEVKGSVCIAVHDAYYLRKLRQFRAKLRECHSKKTQRTNQFCTKEREVADFYRWSFERTLATYRNWVRSEKRWYAQYNLTPPGTPLKGVPCVSPLQYVQWVICTYRGLTRPTPTKVE